MNAFNGTPGPWEVGETLSAEALAVIGDGDSVVCEFPDRLGASVDADARLIAAAPCMLDALRELVALGHPRDPAIIAARAAIRKATGGPT